MIFLVEEVEIESYSVAYVSGYIARRLLKNTSCDNYKACLTTDTVESFHKEISQGSALLTSAFHISLRNYVRLLEQELLF